jgi:hypothetical protein
MQNPFLSKIDPKYVMPMVVFLASRNCEFTHHAYAACAGRFSRVFVGLAEGWLSEAGSDPTADDIAGHIDKIVATTPHSVPSSIFDEVRESASCAGCSRDATPDAFHAEPFIGGTRGKSNWHPCLIFGLPQQASHHAAQKLDIPGFLTYAAFNVSRKLWRVEPTV